MNMILHDVHFRRFDLKQDDTLEQVAYGPAIQAVVANPPFSAKWKGKDNPLNETDDRFSSTAGWHLPAGLCLYPAMIYQMAENATMAVVTMGCCSGVRRKSKSANTLSRN